MEIILCVYSEKRLPTQTGTQSYELVCERNALGRRAEMLWVAGRKCFGSQGGNALDRTSKMLLVAYECVPVRTSAYQYVRVRTNAYQCVPIRTSAYQCVRVRTSA